MRRALPTPPAGEIGAHVRRAEAVDAERKAEIEKVFDAASPDGKITVAKLADLLERLRVCTPGAGADFLRAWDTDHDGQISKAEYVACVV